MEQTKTILVVDDEQLNRTVVGGFLSAMGHDVIHADSGPVALTKLDSSIDLVLLDIMMPGMDGFGVIKAIRSGRMNPEVPVIMVTALSSMDDRLRAVEMGANDFIAKPIDRTELKVRVNSMLRMKEAQDKVRSYQKDLEEMVSVRTRALELAVENLQELQKATQAAHLETIHCLAHAAEFKDEATAEHIRRMSMVAAYIAREYGLPAHEVDIIESASPMHDVGKIGIPDAILLKPGKLDSTEWEVMKKHTSIGHRILGSSSSELLQAGALIALSHHEKWDGSGYPQGLRGDSIPICGRICAIADVFDALISTRPYKQAMSIEQALETMRKGRGTHFDPTLMDLFVAHFGQISEMVRDRLD